MKYILIFAAIVFLVRIDFIMSIFDKQADKFQNSPGEVKPGDTAPATELVPVENDLALKTSPRKSFISMLEDFNSSPDENIKLKAIELMRANPTMFTDKLDRDLESALYRWRDHLLQRNKLTQSFLMEIMKSLKGENLEMSKRLLSFAIDADMMDFLSFYSKSADSNCLLINYLGDPLSEDEKFNELSERLTVLDGIIPADKLAPDIKAYALKCQMVLKLNVDKLKTQYVPHEEPAAVSPEAEAPVSVPSTEPPATATPSPAAPAPASPGTNP